MPALFGLAKLWKGGALRTIELVLSDETHRIEEAFVALYRFRPVTNSASARGRTT
jgi:hypothetical protein